MKRQNGILMPVFSLPSKYGVGDFGKEAYNFIDFLALAKQKIWQVLPLVQTGYGNSPYSSVCSYSYNPYFISPEELYKQKLVSKKDIDSIQNSDKYVDYGFLYNVRYPLLRKAFSNFDVNNKDFIKFLKTKRFEDYALFMTITELNNYAPFYNWEHDLKFRNETALAKIKKEHKDSILFWQFVQYECERQWVNLKEYANSKGVEIIGDMPLYVAWNSVDVWVNSERFKLDENLTPKKVAGVPPDYFCSEGQLWGNPVYDYEFQKQNKFVWWKNRITEALKVYDYVRIDHFRGLDRFYQVDFGKPNAIEGEWVDVPSKELFDTILNAKNKNRIIAEDLGIIDDGVRELIKYTGFPGMKILSFAFNGEQDNLYLPQVLPENSVCYTGTHDNDTLLGLINNFSEWDYNNLVNGVKNSLKELEIDKEFSSKEELVDIIIELGFKSKANLFVIPFADVLKLDTDYRINVPGVVREQNWSIKFTKEMFTKSVANKLSKLTLEYNR